MSFCRVRTLVQIGKHLLCHSDYTYLAVTTAVETAGLSLLLGEVISKTKVILNT